jgi:outer membrane lipoprotein SlyB
MESRLVDLRAPVLGKRDGTLLGTTNNGESLGIIEGSLLGILVGAVVGAVLGATEGCVLGE